MRHTIDSGVPVKVTAKTAKILLLNLTHLDIAKLPREVENFDEGERHCDETQHQVRDGQVHHEHVPRRSHRRHARHDVNHHEVAHRAQDDHERVETDQNLPPRRGNPRLERKKAYF